MSETFNWRAHLPVHPAAVSRLMSESELKDSRRIFASTACSSPLRSSALQSLVRMASAPTSIRATSGFDHWWPFQKGGLKEGSNNMRQMPLWKKDIRL